MALVHPFTGRGELQCTGSGVFTQSEVIFGNRPVDRFDPECRRPGRQLHAGVGRLRAHWRRVRTRGTLWVAIDGPLNEDPEHVVDFA